MQCSYGSTNRRRKTLSKNKESTASQRSAIAAAVKSVRILIKERIATNDVCDSSCADNEECGTIEFNKELMLTIDRIYRVHKATHNTLLLDFLYLMLGKLLRGPHVIRDEIMKEVMAVEMKRALPNLLKELLSSMPDKPKSESGIPTNGFDPDKWKQ